MPRKKAPKGSGMQPRLRPDGRWEARYTPPGATRPKAVYAKTEEECAKKLRKASLHKALRQLDDDGYARLQYLWEIVDHKG